MARYAIGRLYRSPQKENVEDSAAETREEHVKATIGGLEAINFITVATPHLGSRGNKQVSYLTIYSSRALSIINVHLRLEKTSDKVDYMLICFILERERGVIRNLNSLGTRKVVNGERKTLHFIKHDSFELRAQTVNCYSLLLLQYGL